MSIVSTISILTDITASFLSKTKINKLNVLGIELSFKDDSGSIDERIKKIDLAKKNLVEGLSAIEELKTEAQNNQRDAQNALLEIKRLKGDKSNLETELESIKRVIKSDVSTFKKIAGIPTDKEIKRERVMGFITGVFSSIIASGLIWLGIYLYGIIF